MSQPIPERKDIPEEYKWDLSDIFESDDKWLGEYEALCELEERYAQMRGRLGESAQTLLEFYRLEDEAEVRLGKLLGYASCKGDQDTSDNFYQDMRSKAMSRYVAISGASSFSTPEILAIPDAVLDGFFD